MHCDEQESLIVLSVLHSNRNIHQLIETETERQKIVGTNNRNSKSRGGDGSVPKPPSQLDRLRNAVKSPAVMLQMQNTGLQAPPPGALGRLDLYLFNIEMIDLF